MKIKVEIQDKAVRAKIRDLIALGADLSPVTAIIAGKLQRITNKAFDREKDPATGAPWEPLSDVTLERRRKAGRVSRSSGEARKLQMKGDLLNSITAQHDSTSAVVGTNLVYASTHQFGAKQGSFGSTSRGGPIPWGDIPARPYLGVSDRDKASIIDAISRHIHKVIVS